MSNSLSDLVEIIQFKKRLNKEEIAKSIGISRVHLSRQIPLNNQKIAKRLQEMYSDVLQKDTDGKGEKFTVQEPVVTFGNGDIFKEKYIRLLEETNEVLKNKIETELTSIQRKQADLEQKLQMLEPNLNQVLSNQTAMVGLMKDTAVRSAMYHYGRDKKKLDSELHEINKIVGDVLN